MTLQIRNLVKHYGTTRVCDHIDLDIHDGELVALLGPSGSGKTTLLRAIAGLEPADSGEVLFDGVDAETMDVRDRGVGFVFQHYALFNHLSVFENIAFGLRVRPTALRPRESDIRQRVEALLSLVQLEGFAKRRPPQLSGGQRQRVALARALAVQPRVLLLDEPFGALDAQVRKELRRWLRQLHDEMPVTSIFVTHDQEEAMEVADRVVVMNQGHIEQDGSPEAVYEQPATPFVMEFLGNANRLVGADGSAAGWVRPHDIEILPPNTPSVSAAAPAWAATLSHALTVGASTRLAFKRHDDGSTIDVELPRVAWQQLREAQHLQAGSAVQLRARRVMSAASRAG